MLTLRGLFAFLFGDSPSEMLVSPPAPYPFELLAFARRGKVTEGGSVVGRHTLVPSVK